MNVDVKLALSVTTTTPANAETGTSPPPTAAARAEGIAGPHDCVDRPAAAAAWALAVGLQGAT